MEGIFWCEVCRHAVEKMVETGKCPKTMRTCNFSLPVPSPDIKCRRYEADTERIRDIYRQGDGYKKQNAFCYCRRPFLQKAKPQQWHRIAAICITFLVLLAIVLFLLTMIK
ncbi:MAG: hypothetical protein J5642_04385 [Bacteroidales bacterium]|nr:hypothetical protein [Bacteroidales bacterium]